MRDLRPGLGGHSPGGLRGSGSGLGGLGGKPLGLGGSRPWLRDKLLRLRCKLLLGGGNRPCLLDKLLLRCKLLRLDKLLLLRLLLTKSLGQLEVILDRAGRLGLGHGLELLGLRLSQCRGLSLRRPLDIGLLLGVEHKLLLSLLLLRLSLRLSLLLGGDGHCAGG